MRLLFGVVAVAVVALASVGCGGGSETLTKEEYGTQLCQILAEFSTKEKEIGTVNGIADIPVKGPKLLDAKAVVIAKVQKLKPPAEIEDQAASYVSLNEQWRTLVSQFIDAIKANDQAKIQKLGAKFGPLESKIDDIAKNQLGTSACPPTPTGTGYEMRDLGTFGGTSSEAYGINDAGQVVIARAKGVTMAAALASQRALVWKDGTVRWLGTLAGGSTVAFAINAHGQVAGVSAVRGVLHLFLWQNGTMHDLGAVGGGTEERTLGLNDRAEIAGVRVLKNGVPTAGNPDDAVSHAFLWRRGTMINLGTLGAMAGTEDGSSAAADVNERGQVVGSSGIHAFLWQNGTMRDIATPTRGLILFLASAVNNRGQIAGSCLPAAAIGHNRPVVVRPCLWQNGTITVLPTLPGSRSSLPRAINDKGQIVGGVMEKDPSTWRAVIWESGKVTDLGRGVGSMASDINERGQIVGAVNGRAVLWTKTGS
jgi:probable HAF family extracellular repeat protein